MRQANKKIVLHAGDYCFDSAGTHVHTLLGSCISITLWHPQLKIGGMCHFALARPDGGKPGSRLDPRYAEDCIELFRRSAARHRTKISQYEAKIFGGGNMYEKYPNPALDTVEKQPIGEKNAAAAFSLLMNEGANILVAHVGEFGHRRIVYDIATGDVWVRFTPARGTVGDVRSLDGPK
ncbi:MAG: chemotaxis protein CheD [Gammaproteobacteria bacterium]|nr:chemotaxis protein CheD [Gammaproteobacteria bacterium]